MGFCGVESWQEMVIGQKRYSEQRDPKGNAQKEYKRIDELQIVFIVCQS